MEILTEHLSGRCAYNNSSFIFIHLKNFLVRYLCKANCIQVKQ